MPATKNAIVRYRILDELLSDPYHEYSMKDLLEICNYRFYCKESPALLYLCGV